MNIVGYAVLGLAAAVSLAPNAVAISTATVTSDLKFTVSASLGTLSVYDSDGGVDAFLDVAPIDSAADSASGTDVAVSASVGSNFASASTKLYESQSQVQIGVPVGEYAEASASAYGWADLELTGFGSNKYFDLTITPIQASIAMDLLTDSAGLFAYGDGGFAFTLSYSTTRGGGERFHTVSFDLEIEPNDTYSDVLVDTTPFSIRVPTTAFDLKLDWATYAYAEVETAAAVPDAGSTLVLFGMGLVGLAGIRRTKTVG